jgi:hypothetical protein
VTAVLFYFFYGGVVPPSTAIRLSMINEKVVVSGLSGETLAVARKRKRLLPPIIFKGEVRSWQER